MRWGETETCCFVKCYTKHEVLWNPQHENYKNKFIRRKLYQKIIEEFREETGLSLSEPEVRVKIKNLRSTYSQECVKIRQRSGPDGNFKPGLVWFEDMHRVLKNTIKIPEVCNENVTEDNASDSSKVWVPEENDTGDSDQHHDEQFIDAPNDDFLLYIKSEPTSTVPTKSIENSYEPKKKKIKSHRYSSDNSEKSESNSKSILTNDINDEFDIYGKYIASQLRNMDLQKALKIQLEIQSLVSAARLSDLTGNKY